MGRFNGMKIKKPRNNPPGQGGGATPPPTTQLPLFTGAYIRGADYTPGWFDSPFDMVSPGNGTATASFATNAGKAPSIIHWGQQYKRGGTYQLFYPNDHNAVRNYGAIPMLDWTPWETSPALVYYTMADVKNGVYDAHIDNWASGCAAWGKPIFVRPMHEMNGTWFTGWSPAASGGPSAADFVAAWRRIVTRCRSAGATNISWFWCPNVIRDQAGNVDYPLTGLYPGDDVVDWVGADGYCWGDQGLNLSFTDTFASTYDAVYSLASTAKPFMLGEWGCHTTGVITGSKAAWLTDAFAKISAGTFPRLRGVVYFNWNADGMSWCIEDGAGAQAAYAAGISNSLYKSNSYATYTVAGAIPPPS
jgi:mannan endo-1,4-beta-mannosidase